VNNSEKEENKDKPVSFSAGRENRTPVSSLARTCSTTKPYPHCAPGGIRTPTISSEDWCDIHFTTGALHYAVPTIVAIIRKKSKNIIQLWGN
jgi:hypothetical protein